MAELHPHLQALSDALREEQAAEARELARLDALPHAQQVELGHAWPTLRVDAVERRGRTVVVRLLAPRGVQLHEGLGAGDAVTTEVHGAAWPGWVEEVEASRVEVRLEGNEPPEGAPARVRRRLDAATFVRYREALHRADAHRSPLRRVLLGDEPFARIDQPSPLPGLDPAQARAAGAALRTPHLAVVHGPPGTGKTWLLARVLQRLVEEGDRPWALAESNAGADHLALSAAALGLEVVRLGPFARLRPEVVPLTLEERIRKGPLGPPLATLDRELRKAWGTAEGRRLLVERNELRAQARQHALGAAQVLATTFGTLARIAEDLPRAETAVVDEATQATEPAVWVVVPWVQRLVLVGDPHQLGPVVKTGSRVLSTPLINRLVDAGVPMPMLEVQHRMAPAIRELVADVYGPTYTDAPSVAARPGEVRFVDTSGAGAEERDPVSSSLFEPTELDVVAKLVTEERARGTDPSRIAVITPYSAQVARLRARPELQGVEVGTVNAFQGREQDVVIVSFVRSNPEGELGFVADERRLTVALTRARHRLHLVGDAGTLARHPRFARLLDRVAEAGGLRSVWEE